MARLIALRAHSAQPLPSREWFYDPTEEWQERRRRSQPAMCLTKYDVLKGW